MKWWQKILIMPGLHISQVVVFGIYSLLPEKYHTGKNNEGFMALWMLGGFVFAFLFWAVLIGVIAIGITRLMSI